MRCASDSNQPPPHGNAARGEEQGVAPSPRRINLWTGAGRDWMRLWGRGSKEEVLVVQHPPFSHCVLGRTPASGRRDPRRGSVIKRFLGFCGLRSWRGSSWAVKSEPKRGFRQRKSPPSGDASFRRGGPAERSEKGERCTTRTSSLTREPKPRNERWFVPCAKRGGQRTSDSEGPLGGERVARGMTPAKQKHLPIRPLPGDARTTHDFTSAVTSRRRVRSTHHVERGSARRAQRFHRPR